MSRIAVVIPSRLQRNPAAPRPSALYVERAIASVRRQTVAAQHEIRFFVGIDQGVSLALGPALGDDVEITHGGVFSQAAALNAAAKCAVICNPPDFIAFLEDDDQWHPQKLDYQLAGLARGFDFVSCSQREVTPDGDYVRVNDFATASGWVLRADLWSKVGPFDESFKWHLDNDFLGRLNKSGARRLHFAEHAATVNPRPWLHQVSKFSKIAVTDGLLEPLVTRTVNDQGGMARIARDPEARSQSQREHMMLWEKYGAVIPW